MMLALRMNNIRACGLGDEFASARQAACKRRRSKLLVIGVVSWVPSSSYMLNSINSVMPFATIFSLFMVSDSMHTCRISSTVELLVLNRAIFETSHLPLNKINMQCLELGYRLDVQYLLRLAIPYSRPVGEMTWVIISPCPTEMLSDHVDLPFTVVSVG